MIICVVGCLDDESQLPIRGCGKTMVVVYYVLKEFSISHRNIISNLHLVNIPYEYMTSQEIYDAFMNEKLPDNPLIIFDEISKFLNSLGTSTKVITKFVNGFIAQTRKLDADIFCTSQRYADVVKRFRSQVDMILIPVKIHADGNACYRDNCKEHHYIEIESHKPWRHEPIATIDAEIIGKYYDTREIIFDELKC